MQTVIESIDRLMIDLGVHHSSEWFGEPKSRDEVTAMYRYPLLKPSKDPSLYAPTISCKFNKRNNVPQAQAFDVHKQPIRLHDVLRGSQVKVVFAISDIWFYDQKFGITLYVQSLMHSPPPPPHPTFIASQEEVVDDGDEDEH
jgi:hypothetical protein